MTSTADASGEPSAALSISNGVLYSGCWGRPFTYRVTLPSGSTGWSLDITAYGPDGLEVGGDYLYGSTDSPAPGQGAVQICGSEMAGQYTLGGQLEWSDQDYNSHSTTLSPVTFSMRKPLTKTTLAASATNPHYGQRVRLRVTSKDERPAGYFANRYAVVRVQQYREGRWLTLRGGQLTTGDYGTTSMPYRFASRHAERFRAVTLTTDAYTRSVSPTVVLR